MQRESSQTQQESNKEEIKSPKLEDIVEHSISTDSNIIALSFDECDEYSQISFKIGKPIRSPILLSTLITSKNALGNKKFRKVTIKNPHEIVAELNLYKEECSGLIYKNSVNTNVLDLLLDNIHNKIDSIDEQYSLKKLFIDEFLSLDKNSIKKLFCELAQIYEQCNTCYDDLLNKLNNNTYSVIGDSLIIKINPSLFIYMDRKNPNSGILCSIEGLMIIINNSN